jgi:glycosyltransferase involved in cell wall biosynthesis
MRLYAATVLHGARRSERVITVSAAVRDELAAAGVRSDRIRVVHPQVDPRFSPAPGDRVAAVRARFGLDRDFAVLTGWQDPRKGAATAVAAHRRVVAAHPHDLVLVGGSHPTFAEVRVAASPTVRTVGRVSDDDLVALLTGAAVLLYPSRYEGFGLPPLEAQACGTPAVASDIASLRESTAGSVRLVAPDDVEGWADALRAGLLGQLSCASPAALPPRELGQQLADALSD